nr:hypothetical protein [Paraburkholderia polaris]
MKATENTAVAKLLDAERIGSRHDGHHTAQTSGRVRMLEARQQSVQHRHAGELICMNTCL